MKKILFKIIVVNSESKVVYGNVSRNAALEYLVNVTPKNSIDFARLQMLSSKYVIAREIKVTTKVEVTVTADKPSVLPLSSVLKQRYKKSLIMVLLLKSETFFNSE